MKAGIRPQVGKLSLIPTTEVIRLRPATQLLLFLNRFFPRPDHPFNRALAGRGTYADWQFEQAPRTLSVFRYFADPQAMVAGKRVLDLGCGAGGKAVYCATLGAREVVGVDIVPHYREEGEALARRHGVPERVRFITADATQLPLPSGSLDAVLASDVVEHLADPEAGLREAWRVLAPGGRVYISFPPYNHPYGAHLSDAIGIPWVHLFFSEPVLGEAYQALVAHLPDAEQRLNLRFGRDRQGALRITYINHMTIRRFRSILGRLPFRIAYYYQSPLRLFLQPLARLAPEYFTRLVVCVLEKPQEGQ